MKKISRAGDSAFKGRSIPVAVLLIFVVLLSAGSGLYAGASFFAQQAPNVTITTTIYTTTSWWTTSTIWSTMTTVVQGVLTTVQYATSTSTTTVTAGTTSALYEYYNTGDDDWEWVGGANWRAQTFTVGATGHTITSVKLKMFKSTGGTLNVAIRAPDANGLPTGADLTTGTIDGSTFTTNTAGAWYEIALTPYTLSANTKYAIVCHAASGVNLGWRDDSTNSPYIGGNLCMSANGTTWTMRTTYDFLFEIW